MLSIASLDRDEYAQSDTFSFRLQVQNKGPDDVLLPWTPNLSEVETSESAPLVRCLLMFESDLAGIGRVTFPVALLYGSTFTPGTLRRIRPGETVEVIGESGFHFATDALAEQIRAKMPVSLPMVAPAAFLTSVNGVAFDDVVSRKKMPVVLHRRPHQ
jgi:hypothetical protein